MKKIPYNPGIYPGLAEAEYNRIDAWRGSELVYGRENTLAHLRAAIDCDLPVESTEALEFGIILHAATFQPDEFERRATEGPRHDVKDRETGLYKSVVYGADTKAMKAFRAENPKALVMAGDEKRMLEVMGDALRKHPAAGALIRACDSTELTMVWEDEETGEMLKYRADGLPHACGIDLKSTTCARPEVFTRDAYFMGYVLKAAMFLDGWKALHDVEHVFEIIAVEKPKRGGHCGISVFEFQYGSEEHMIGRKHYREVLRDIVAAKQTGYWPSYSPQIQPFKLPRDLLRREEANAA